MALEDFTTYTAGGAQIADVTVAANQLTCQLTEQDQAWVYDDKGAGHFTNAFEHHFITRATSYAINAYSAANWGVSNTPAEAYQAQIDNTREAVFLGWSGGDVQRLREPEDADWDDSIGLSEDTQYYIKVVRSGATGNTVTAYIYTGSIGGVLVDTIAIALTDNNQTYRYVYGMNARDEAAGTNETQYYNVYDLDLNEGAPPAGAVGLLLKETELGNSLFGGLIHVA